MDWRRKEILTLSLILIVIAVIEIFLLVYRPDWLWLVAAILTVTGFSIGIIRARIGRVLARLTDVALLILLGWPIVSGLAALNPADQIAAITYRIVLLTGLALMLHIGRKMFRALIRGNAAI